MPSCALSRRDPPHGKNGFSKAFGFTIIELMIAVAVLAIITSLALPSYQTLLEKRRVTSAAEQVMAFLSSAQLESVKRNREVGVNLQSSGEDWCLVMVEDATAPDDFCDCLTADACTADNSLRVLAWGTDDQTYRPLFDAASSTLGDEDDILEFDPVRGLTADGASGELQFLSSESTYALNVELSPTGRVKLCNDSERASTKVPGYEDC